MTRATIVAVARDGVHRFSKRAATAIELIAGLGVEGDAHRGVTVQHRSRVAIDPAQPNLRQVHLIHAELLDELNSRGFAVAPGDMGENVTTRGVDLLGLAEGSLLHLGEAVVLEVTGLRNPCRQIEQFQAGLLAAVLDRAPDGSVIRKSGVMAVVRHGGTLRPGDPIHVEAPAPPRRALRPV